MGTHTTTVTNREPQPGVAAALKLMEKEDIAHILGASKTQEESREVVSLQIIWEKLDEILKVLEKIEGKKS